MADIAHSLYIKYGLTHQPSDGEIRRWRDEAERLIRQGVPGEDAGIRAAKATFYDFGQAVYASEADTIEALLGAARNK